MRVALNAMIRLGGCLLVCWLVNILNVASPQAHAQDIWEYSPYKVCVWFAIDPSMDQSAAAQTEFVQQTAQLLKNTFGAAWDLTTTRVPANMKSLVERGPERLVVDNFSNTDLVLLLDKDNPSLKTLRVFDTAIEQLNKIGMTISDHQQMLVDSQSFVSESTVSAVAGVAATIAAVPATSDYAASSGEASKVGQMLDKATELFDSPAELFDALKAKKVSAVLIPRRQVAMFAELTRSLATILPWHTERVVREYEKLFIVHCSRDGESYRVAVRELDCPMRLFGPTMMGETVTWKNLSHIVADEVVRAFAPVGRIEEALGKVVQLLNRAGGLADDANPARILPGDVLQPVIRREDRRGAATLLEPIPWTYIGITKADGINLEGTAYSALGNVLQGKQTRRAQRVALRVRPTGNHSDVKVVVRTNPSQAQSGCQVYERDLVTEELRFVGHTDWRGVITIERPEVPGGILPESIRLERAAARRAASEAADKAALATAEAQKALEVKAGSAAATATAPPPKEEDIRGGGTTKPAPEVELVDGTAGAAAAVPDSAQSAVENAARKDANDLDVANRTVPLRQPLLLLYVKSGDTVLARLPLVPGLNDVDIADLPSDARRLEAEAALRGFQGEIMDLIGKRAILSARVAHYLKARKFKESEEAIAEARRLSDYKTMADTLDGIQRRLLDETKEQVPMAAKSRIDRMTQTTRDMLQKYLENDLVQKLERELKLAQSAAAADEKAVAAAAAKQLADKAAEKEGEKPAEKPKEPAPSTNNSGAP